MSQRGSCHSIMAQTTVHRRWWTCIRSTLAFTLALSCMTNLALIAQDSSTTICEKMVMLRVDGDERQVSTVKETVQELLHQEGIVLNTHDRITPSLATALTDEMVVTVTRITFEVIEERVTVPPPITTRWDRRMTVHPVTIREGTPGIAVRKRSSGRRTASFPNSGPQKRGSCVSHVQRSSCEVVCLPAPV